MADHTIDIDYVARLARVALTDEEKATFSAQLGEVLQHMEKLSALDTGGIEPTAHSFPLTNILDADEPREPLPREEALRNAPDQRDGQIVVPTVVES